MLSAIDFRNVLDIVSETHETYCGFDILEQRNSEQALASEEQQKHGTIESSAADCLKIVDTKILNRDA